MPAKHLHDNGGYGLTRDRDKAAQLYQRACDIGSASGCGALAFSCERRSIAKAAVLYQKACDGRHLTSCHTLGLFYSEGRGVRRDRLKAARLFVKACGDDPSIDSAFACRHAAEAYEHGYGVAQDRVTAVRFYQKACDSGFELGCDDAERLRRAKP